MTQGYNNDSWNILCPITYTGVISKMLKEQLKSFIDPKVRGFDSVFLLPSLLHISHLLDHYEIVRASNSRNTFNCLKAQRLGSIGSDEMM